ncbi:transglutaminase family protein [Salinicola endophyticus]
MSLERETDFMRYRVSHSTRYDYAAPVSLCHNEARLTPRRLTWQLPEPTRLTVTPVPAVLQTRRDVFGNEVNYFSVQEIHQSLTVTAETCLSTGPRPQPPAVGAWEAVRATSRERVACRPYQLDSPFVARHAALRDFAAISFTPGRPLLEAAAELNQRIFEGFLYDPGYTTLATPVLDVLEARRGVCQDFAHLMVGCLRSLGLAARYVSGYLETRPPPGQPRLVGADASHAWSALYLPSWGWLEFDPTNGTLPGERHLITGWGRDYGDVPPLKGVMSGGGSHALEVAVDVEPLAVDPA